MKKKPGAEQAGFTLLEVMIALAILSLAAAALMRISSQAIHQSAALESKGMALIIAQNKLAQLQVARAWPEPGASAETLTMAGHKWEVSLVVDSTDNVEMRRAHVSVALLPQKKSILDLDGFLGSSP